MKFPLVDRMLIYLFAFISIISCKQKKQTSADQANELASLKRGELISCGPAGNQFGKLDFTITSNPSVQEEFNLGVKMLHSFEYDEAEKVFARILDKNPNVAMAWWGVAMANFHALWTPPTDAELIKGSKAIDVAKSIQDISAKEKEFINAAATFFYNWKSETHKNRTLAFERSMEELYRHYPADPEAAIFYALSLDAAADPSDKSFSRQLKAGKILDSLYSKYPDHPGIVHYIIHTYDAPELADRALAAARRYAEVAPSSAHALHMPSHIFTRLGLWKESIQSNRHAISSALCYAESAGIKGHWDEELHGIDYLTYAFLQSGQNDSAKKQVAYLASMTSVSPVNFKVAYAFAAVPSRYLLENKLWPEAANLESNPSFISWKEYPWQNAIIHFTRALGNIHTGNIENSKKEIEILKSLQDELTRKNDSYKANQVQVQVKTAEAWLLFRQGKNSEALTLMNAAADLEDATEKHPVTPCEVMPARELLADMLLQMHMPAKALDAYKTDLKRHPNRLNGIAGENKAAELSAGNKSGN
jgi:tetratricopeptide (TPR) repeat protein